MLSFKTFLKEKVMKKIQPVELKLPDLRKDENRVKTFLRKVKDGHPFATVSHGDNVIIDKNEYDEVEAFMTADNGVPELRTKLVVNTNKGKLTIVSDFLKSGDLGGRGVGSGTSAETLAMNDFNEKLNAILQKQAISQIKLNINGRTVNCAAMVKTEGKYRGREPKSDMTIVDALGNPVAYISHKAGRSAKDYQQYGGLSDSALSTNIESAAKNEIKAFMLAVNSLRPNGLQSGESFYRIINNKSLIQQSMYGPEFGSQPSINNVDEFHLGNMTLKGKGSGPYTIESVHKGINGEIPKDSYKAVYFIRFQQKRGDARAAGVTVKNARVGIFPIAKISSTTKEI